MIFDYMILIIIVVALIIGAISDIRTREVPDWLNYGLIFVGFGIRIIYSLYAHDWGFILHGIFGFAILFALACAMFYGGQWGGGDAKMMMGLGALIGFRPSAADFSVSFLFNVFLVGAIYGLLWSIALAISRWKVFIAEAKSIHSDRRMRRIRNVILISAAVLAVISLFVGTSITKLMLLTFVLFYICTFYLWISIKAIEKTCMLKLVEPERLTEGDWIAKDIIVSGKKIAGPKDLGISIEQIKRLIRLKKQRKIKKVLVKEGIPFVPSFLLAFVATYLLGNLFLMFL